MYCGLHVQYVQYVEGALIILIGRKNRQCCFFLCVFFPFILDFNGPAGVTQEEGNTGFSIHLLPAVLALIFLARRIQPFLSLVDREVEFCVLTI